MRFTLKTNRKNRPQIHKCFLEIKQNIPELKFVASHVIYDNTYM